MGMSRMWQMPSLGAVLALLAACTTLCCPVEGGEMAAEVGKVRFVQDRFAIGLWWPPPMDRQADRRYAEVAEANFNLVIAPGCAHGANTPQKAQRQLVLCRKHGLKVLVWHLGLSAEKLPDGPACWGYHLRDEPNAKDFPSLARRVAAMRKAHPGRLTYINLFPNYANQRQLGTSTYEEHVARFVEQVDPDVLSMDHYPVFKPSGDGRDGYCANLAVLRKHALARGIPFWNFFNTMPFGRHSDPTEAQLRWQICASLTYGAKGVLYFCYFPPDDPRNFPKSGAIILRDDRRTRHWYQARRLNARLKKLGPVLMKLTSTAVHRIRPGDKPAAVLTDAPIRNIARANPDPTHDYLVGVFRHNDGRRAVMLQNYRFAFTVWPTVEFDAAPGHIREVDPQSGKEILFLDDSPDMPGLDKDTGAI